MAFRKKAAKKENIKKNILLNIKPINYVVTSTNTSDRRKFSFSSATVSLAMAKNEASYEFIRQQHTSKDLYTRNFLERKPETFL